MRYFYDGVIIHHHICTTNISLCGVEKMVIRRRYRILMIIHILDISHHIVHSILEEIISET